MICVQTHLLDHFLHRSSQEVLELGPLLQICRVRRPDLGQARTHEPPTNMQTCDGTYFAFDWHRVVPVCRLTTTSPGKYTRYEALRGGIYVVHYYSSPSTCLRFRRSVSSNLFNRLIISLYLGFDENARGRGTRVFAFEYSIQHKLVAKNVGTKRFNRVNFPCSKKQT